MYGGFYGMSEEEIEEWANQQSISARESAEARAEWLTNWRQDHPFCDHWSDDEIFRFRNNPLFQTNVVAEHGFCKICEKDLGAGATGGNLVCSFRCALVIAEREHKRVEARYQASKVETDKDTRIILASS